MAIVWEIESLNPLCTKCPPMAWGLQAAILRAPSAHLWPEAERLQSSVHQVPTYSLRLRGCNPPCTKCPPMTWVWEAEILRAPSAHLWPEAERLQTFVYQVDTYALSVKGCNTYGLSMWGCNPPSTKCPPMAWVWEAAILRAPSAHLWLRAPNAHLWPEAERLQSSVHKTDNSVNSEHWRDIPLASTAARSF